MNQAWDYVGNQLEAYLQNAPEPCTTAADLRQSKVGTACPHCHRIMNDNHKDPLSVTVDHILPKSLFPHLMFDYNNLEVICLDCNRKKGNRLPDHRKEFYKSNLQLRQLRKRTRELLNPSSTPPPLEIEEQN